MKPKIPNKDCLVCKHMKEVIPASKVIKCNLYGLKKGFNSCDEFKERK